MALREMMLCAGRYFVAHSQCFLLACCSHVTCSVLPCSPQLHFLLLLLGARSCTHGAWEACASHPPIPWGVCSCSGRSAAARLALLWPVAQQTTHVMRPLRLLLQGLLSCLVLSPLSRGLLSCLALASALAVICFLFSALALSVRSSYSPGAL